VSKEITIDSDDDSIRCLGYPGRSYLVKSDAEKILEAVEALGSTVKLVDSALRDMIERRRLRTAKDKEAIARSRLLMRSAMQEMVKQAHQSSSRLSQPVDKAEELIRKGLAELDVVDGDRMDLDK
jgi:hypothetical protein